MRHGIGEFNKSSFLANLKNIHYLTLTPTNIRSGFKRYSYVLFCPRLVLNEIRVNLVLVKTEQIPQEDELPSKETLLGDIWSLLDTHVKLKQQAQAIQGLLRSSASPPDIPTRKQNRQNVKKFTKYVLSTNLVNNRLTSYAIDALVAQRNQKSRNSRRGQHVQKGGVVYAQDINREVANMAYNKNVYHQEFTTDQKVTRLIMYSMVIPQFMRIVSSQKKLYKQDTNNRVQKFKMREKRKLAKKESQTS